jgi:hypothetical protein
MHTGTQQQQLQQIPSSDVMATTANGLATCNGRFHQHRHLKMEQPPLRRNGSLRNSRSADATMLEMEAFVPMLATIPVEEMPSHLDTKGGYPSGSRGSVAGRIITPTTTIRKEVEDYHDYDDADRSELPLLSLSHSVVGQQQQHEMIVGSGLDGTILSQATETTCLSLDYSGRNRRRRRRKHHLRRQGSLHSHDDDDEGDSSLHSLDSRTTTSSNSQRQLRSSSEAISCTNSCSNSRRSLQEDNDTGMCRTDHHHHHQMMNDSGLVVVGGGVASVGGVAVSSSSSNNNRSQTTTTLTPKGDPEQQQLVIST